MESKSHQSGISYPLFIIFLFLLVFGAAILFLFAKVNSLSDVVQTQTRGDIDATTPVSGVPENVTLDEVKKTVSDAVSTISANLSSKSTTTTQTIYIKPSATPHSLQTVYIPLGSSGSTQSQDWIGLDNNQVYIDFYTDYGSSAYANWDVFMKVDQGNGMAYARLFDVTNGVAVDGSEVTTTSANTIQVSSGQIKLRSGRNLYRVQIKSLNGYTAFIDSARIKITY